MSFSDYAPIWKLAIPSSWKIVLLALADHANKGECFPSISTIAAKTGLHRTTVIRILKVLEEEEFIKKTSRKKTSNLYRLCLASRGVEPGGGDGGSRPPGPLPCATQRVAESDFGGSPVRHESVTQSISEPTTEPRRSWSEMLEEVGG